jgi:hypothetical protein
MSGETESLKTWFALILAKAELDAGYSVAWADLDAMGSGELLARLRGLGVADDVIGSRFLYYEPAERLINDVLEDVTGDITERGIRLFVVDAFNPMLSLHGLDPSSTPDIETFWREVADPICRAGAAPTLLDHVAKNAGTSKYAYGSERKASGAIVHVGFRLLHPLTRGGEGRTLLIRRKDRPGYLPHPNIGRLIVTSDGDNIVYKLEPDLSQAREGSGPPATWSGSRSSWRSTTRPSRRSGSRTTLTGRASTSARRSTSSRTRVTSPGRRTARAIGSSRFGRTARQTTRRQETTTRKQPRPDLVPTIQPRPDLVPKLTSTPLNPASMNGSTSSRTSSLSSSPVIPEPHLVPSSPPLRWDGDEVEADLVETRSDRPLPGDKGYLPWLYAKFEAGHVTEGEWRQRSRLHEHLARAAA